MKTLVYYFYKDNCFVFESLEEAKDYKYRTVGIFSPYKVTMFAVDFDGSETCLLKNSKDYYKHIDLCTVPLWWADIHLADGSRDSAYIYSYGGTYVKSSINNSGAAHLVDEIK